MSAPRYFTLRKSTEDNPIGPDWIAVAVDTGEIIARSIATYRAHDLAVEQGFVALPEDAQLLETAINRACERGAGWLELTDPDGTELEIGGEPRDPLANQVLHAITVAQNHASQT